MIANMGVYTMSITVRAVRVTPEWVFILEEYARGSISHDRTIRKLAAIEVHGTLYRDGSFVGRAYDRVIEHVVADVPCAPADHERDECGACLDALVCDNCANEEL
jgi:hypothetical protein